MNVTWAMSLQNASQIVKEFKRRHCEGLLPGPLVDLAEQVQGLHVAQRMADIVICLTLHTCTGPLFRFPDVKTDDNDGIDIIYGERGTGLIEINLSHDAVDGDINCSFTYYYPRTDIWNVKFAYDKVYSDSTDALEIALELDREIRDLFPHTRQKPDPCSAAFAEFEDCIQILRNFDTSSDMDNEGPDDHLLDIALYLGQELRIAQGLDGIPDVTCTSYGDVSFEWKAGIFEHCRLILSADKTFSFTVCEQLGEKYRDFDGTWKSNGAKDAAREILLKLN